MSSIANLALDLERNLDQDHSRIPVGQNLGRLGFGAAPIGNLLKLVSNESSDAVLSAAWEGGVRYFDTAPHYGLGLSEHRLGRFLQSKPREQFFVSTKVGRLLVPNPDFRGGDDLANGFAVPNTMRRQFDMSESGIRQSLEDSLERMRLDRVDILFLHDPDDYDLDLGLRQGLPALIKLREEGLVSAIGVGVNDAAVAARAVRESDLDLIMVAGRYTLLEQPALEELLPLCQKRQVQIANAAVYNSGLLATSTPNENSSYNYSQVPVEKLNRARQLATVCAEFGVELPTAAIQFSLNHPAVATVVIGTSNANSMRENIERLNVKIPDELWTSLIAQGLIPTS